MKKTKERRNIDTVERATLYSTWNLFAQQRNFKLIVENQKGITLVALVVTVVVLLILAGVTIATITGDSGLINKTNDAKIATEIVSIKEEITTDILTEQAENKGNISDNTLKEILEKHGVLSKEGEKLIDKTLTTTKGNHEIKVSDIFSGTTVKDGVAPVIEVKITDTDGKVLVREEEEKAITVNITNIAEYGENYTIEVVDDDGNIIKKTSKVVGTLVGQASYVITKEGSYTITVTGTKNGITEKTQRIEKTELLVPVKFFYTGETQEYVVPENGKYRIELWGAEGNYYDWGSNSQNTGKGAYTSGEIYLTKGTQLYIYVGQHSHDSSSYDKVMFNGGGCAGAYCQNHYSASGGGATDIRLTIGEWDDFESLKSRIMVAGAGGGNLVQANNGKIRIGGIGGTLKGGDYIYDNSFYAKGGTQTSGGEGTTTSWGNDNKSGEFGKGGSGAKSGTTPMGAGGGSRILWRSWRKPSVWI